MPTVPTPNRSIFASAARPDEIQNFPDWTRGWGLTFDPGQTEGIPPMEWMNGAFNRLSTAIAYLLQRGVAPYVAAEDYQVGSITVYNDDIWFAVRASKNVTPGSSSADWKGFFAAVAAKLDDSAKAADSNLLDGLDSSAFTKETRFAEITDCNTTVFSGIYPVDNATGWPRPGISGTLLVLSATITSYATQIAVTLGGEVFIRHIHNSIWGSWSNFYTPTLGFNQSYSTGSRSFDTVYSNTTGKPIFIEVVSVTTSGGGGHIRLEVTAKGVTTGLYSDSTSTTGMLCRLNAIIPPGATYKAYGSYAGMSLHQWSELR